MIKDLWLELNRLSDTLGWLSGRPTTPLMSAGVSHWWALGVGEVWCRLTDDGRFCRNFSWEKKAKEINLAEMEEMINKNMEANKS